MPSSLNAPVMSTVPEDTNVPATVNGSPLEPVCWSFSNAIKLRMELFKFVWEMDQTLAPIYWVGVDYSQYVNRYNLFFLDEGVDVTFRIGQYRYWVYESPVPIVVDPNTNELGLNLVEEGRMVVEGISNSIYE